MLFIYILPSNLGLLFIMLMDFAAKSGVNPSDCVDLVKHVKLGCPNLEFSGLMTIGMPDYTSTPLNFQVVFIIFYKKKQVAECWHYFFMNLHK